MADSSGQLRTPAQNGGDDAATTAPATPTDEDGGAGFDTVADLVAELVSVTQLVGRDRLAAARGRAGTGSFAEALEAEGLAQPEGVGMALARRYNLPYVDISRSAVAPDSPSSSRFARCNGSARCRSRSSTTGCGSPSRIP